jgi:hypothetical protein
MAQINFRTAHKSCIPGEICCRLGCDVVPAVGKAFRIWQCVQDLFWVQNGGLLRITGGLLGRAASTYNAKRLCMYMTDAKRTRTERINLLNDFTEAHARAFQKAIYCDMLLRGGAESFDFRSHYKEFILRFRDDCGGNPAIAFTVEDAGIRPLSKIHNLPNIKASLKAGRTMRAKLISDLLKKTLWAYLWQVHPLHYTPSFDAVLKGWPP